MISFSWITATLLTSLYGPVPLRERLRVAEAELSRAPRGEEEYSSSSSSGSGSEEGSGSEAEEGEEGSTSDVEGVGLGGSRTQLQAVLGQSQSAASGGARRKPHWRKHAEPGTEFPQRAEMESSTASMQLPNPSWKG